MRNGSVIMCTLILVGTRCVSMWLLMETEVEKAVMCLRMSI